jgi:hypothetical protein
MSSMIAQALELWSGVFADSAIVRSLVGFAHLGGLLVGGGYALSEDRRILHAGVVAPDARLSERSAHGVVLTGLGVVMASGVLLAAADIDTYLHSTTFQIKMGLVVALLANGWTITRAEAEVARCASAWPRLRRASAISVALWLLITLAGSVLPNV